jgi:hypothetical protein
MSTCNLLGPLTTTFTPPPECSSLAFSPTLSNIEQTIAWAGQNCQGGKIQDATSCWPPARVTTRSPPLLGWGFYSPGLSCPSGMFPACQADPTRNPGAEQFSFQYPLGPKETASGCCPMYVFTPFHNQFF